MPNDTEKLEAEHAIFRALYESNAQFTSAIAVPSVLSALTAIGCGPQSAAHDAAVRADQAEKDAQIAHDWLWDDDDKSADLARETEQQIRRAVVLTPTTDEPTICGALAEAMGGYTTYECKLPPNHDGRHDWDSPTTKETEQ
jgi:hypothetical protein